MGGAGVVSRDLWAPGPAVGRCVHEQASSVAPGRLVSVARGAVRGGLQGGARRGSLLWSGEAGGGGCQTPDPQRHRDLSEGTLEAVPQGHAGLPGPQRAALRAQEGFAPQITRPGGDGGRACRSGVGTEGASHLEAQVGVTAQGVRGLLGPRRGLPGGLRAKVQKREASGGAAPVCLGAEWYGYFLPHEACVQGGVGGGVRTRVSLPAEGVAEPSPDLVLCTAASPAPFWCPVPA